MAQGVLHQCIRQFGRVFDRCDRIYDRKYHGYNNRQYSKRLIRALFLWELIDMQPTGPPALGGIFSYQF
jgi:hypothetical protein